MREVSRRSAPAMPTASSHSRRLPISAAGPARWAHSAHPRLARTGYKVLEDYKGQVKMVFRDYPLPGHKNARPAGRHRTGVFQLNPSVPDLKPFFSPASVALVGATDDLTRFAGRVLMRMMNFGYQGKVYPVNPRFKEVRGMGMLIGAQMADAWEGRAKDILPLAIEEGVMALIAGPNVLRMAPSLVIPEADIAEGMARLERAIERLVASA